VIILPPFNTQGALAYGREHDIRLQVLRDPLFEIKPLYAGRGQNNGIKIFGLQFF
jgi:hypothetical protein